MSLQGQGVKAYQSYMDRAMKKAPKVELPESEGLMNRNKPIDKNKDADPSDYLLDQFTELQKLRAGLNNG